MQKLTFSQNRKNWLCWEGQRESKWDIWELLAPDFSLHMDQLSVSHFDSDNQHIMWMKRIEVEYLTPNLKYKHLVTGSVYTDTSSVRINDPNPNTGEERKTIFGKSIPSFNSFLISLREFFFLWAPLLVLVASQCANCITYHCSTGKINRLACIKIRCRHKGYAKSQILCMKWFLILRSRKFSLTIMGLGVSSTNLYLLNLTNFNLFRKLLYNFCRNEWLFCSILSIPWVEYSIV